MIKEGGGGGRRWLHPSSLRVSAYSADCSKQCLCLSCDAIVRTFAARSWRKNRAVTRKTWFHRVQPRQVFYSPLSLQHVYFERDRCTSFPGYNEKGEMGQATYERRRQGRRRHIPRSRSARAAFASALGFALVTQSCKCIQHCGTEGEKRPGVAPLRPLRAKKGCITNEPRSLNEQTGSGATRC